MGKHQQITKLDFARRASKLLFSRTKLTKKQVIQVLKDAGYQLDNFKLIEVVDVYERLKTTGTHRFDLNRDVLQQAITIVNL